MNVTVDYEGGAKFAVTSGTHSLVCDQPASNGGADEGMTPPELLLASLGTCAGYYAVQYLKTRNLTAGVKVEVSAEKAQGPARLGSFRIGVSVDRELDERHLQGISRAVNGCVVHNTLTHSPEIEVSVSTPFSLAVH
jgi:uncharacterized OsmC-like protein